MDFFHTENIVKNFANHTALDNVSLIVPAGKIFCLLGPIGAGKTTLIRIINNITAPDSGTVIFNGEKLKQKHTELIGYLPEERGLYKKMKVGEQALYLTQLKGLSKKEALIGLKHWFEKFEIQDWWNKKVEELSKGMQQKIQFIITILHKPKLLIFDEPFSGFDPINTKLLKKEILNIKNEGSTIIFSTHNMESVEELCDNIALINNSKKILDGQINDIKQEYKSNIYEICFLEKFNKLAATLTADYKILSVSKNKNNYNVKIKLLKQIPTNQIITKLMQFGNIISFKEVIPSMNDIFIRVVEENKKETISSN